MHPIKLGIIGCGIAARDLHWPALQKLKDHFEITAVCNHTEPKAKEFAAMVGGVDYVLDYQELLKREDVEAVDIALPIHLNYSVTRDALRMGKHVLLEKPLAANLDEAKGMISFHEKYAPVMMVAENYRYRPLYIRVRKLIDDGMIGTPYAANWNVYSRVTPATNKYAETKWRINHQYPGGFITDGGVHNVAVFRLLFGEIVRGSAQVQAINPGIGEIDTIRFQFLTEKNVNGGLQIFFTANGYSENKMVIFGEDGTIIIENNRIVVKKADQSDIQETVEDDGGYQAEFEDFYQAIRNNRPVMSSFHEGYRDLFVILGALTSAEKNEVVQFI